MSDPSTGLSPELDRLREQTGLEVAVAHLDEPARHTIVRSVSSVNVPTGPER